MAHGITTPGFRRAFKAYMCRHTHPVPEIRTAILTAPPIYKWKCTVCGLKWRERLGVRTLEPEDGNVG